jgi:hemolysin activation/secretion protein
VRGFILRGAANDKGTSGQFELYAPEMGGATGVENLRVRALAFFDYGHLRRNQPQPGEATAITLSSFGAGLRINLPRTFSARFDVANIVQGEGVASSGKRTFSFTLSAMF